MIYYPTMEFRWVLRDVVHSRFEDGTPATGTSEKILQQKFTPKTMFESDDEWRDIPTIIEE